MGGPENAVASERLVHEVMPETRPEVREAYDRLEMEVESTHRLVNALEERLHDLLGPERPVDPSSDREKAAWLTSFGGRLHGTADTLGSANRRLDYLLDRLREGF